MMSIFGEIKAPQGVDNFAAKSGGEGIFYFINNIFRIAAVIAGIYLVVQIILAGYGYLTANGDPKKISASWEKIWQSILGLAIIVAAFAIAGLIGKLLGFDNILSPTLKWKQTT